MKLNCQNPQVILNPLAVELITKYGNVTIKGEERKMSRARRNLYNYDAKKISPKYNNIGESDLPDCYITNHDDGETYPLYVQVPCGHCENCRSRKVNAFVQRCELETQMYECKPIFLTLTYNEENKPKEGVSVRDCQLFFKRLRINLQRAGYNERIRYVLVAEYGRRTHRPHYHAILWNLRQTDMVAYREVGDIIEKSWSNGFEMHRLVDPGDNKSFYYTAKYLRKDCPVPDGCNPPFVLSSRGDGGIGSSYVDKYGQEILRKNNVNPKFVNKWTGKVKALTMSKYVLDRMAPTISSSIPSKVKKSLRTLNLCMTNFAVNGDSSVEVFKEDYKRYNETFKEYVFCPMVSAGEVKKSSILQCTRALLIRQSLEACQVLDNFLRKGKAFLEQARKKAQAREVYLSRLFLNMEEITDDMIRHRAYKYRVSAALAAQRELF